MSAAAVNPIKLAIVGSGPSAFYAATRVLLSAAAANPASSSSSTPPVSAVHMYESLPTPFGLVRAGVAPDHPDVKNVTNRFTEVVKAPSSSGRAGFRFFGNVRVVAGPSASSPPPSSAGDGLGRQRAGGAQRGIALELPLQELLTHYTHIILAYGSAQARTLGAHVGGQDLRGVCSALDFVNWYNGHPDAHTPSARTPPWLDIVRPGARHVSIVGAGNVALDVARILLRARTPTSPFLASTDIPTATLEQLAQSDVEHVSIVARRGVAQVAFTNKEVREMLTLGETEGIDMVPLAKETAELALDDVARLKALSDQAAKEAKEGGSGAETKEARTKRASDLAGELRIRKRLVDLLVKGSKAPKASAVGHRKSWSIEPFRAPEAILPRESSDHNGSTGHQHVGRVRWSITQPSSTSKTAASAQLENNSVPSPAPTALSQTPTWGGGTPSKATGAEPEWGSVRPTGQVESTQTDSVVYSLGYVGAPLPLASESGTSKEWQELIPFDKRRAIIVNENGAVDWNAAKVAQLGLNANQLPRLHTTGWIGRGPVGVIASTMYDAYDTVDRMLSQAASTSTKQVAHPTAPPPRIQDALFSHHRTNGSLDRQRKALTPAPMDGDKTSSSGSTGLCVSGLGQQVIEWEDWEVIDELERAAGAAHSPQAKEREKIVAFT
ncbi:hypothetical protein V8E36_000004 [Tilletia maclaganii]